MKEDKEGQPQQKPFSTCLEGSPCAEMMQRIFGGQGCGSLCEEMMRSFMKTGHEGKEEPKDDQKKEEK